MARSLIESLTDEFDPSDYKDEYRSTLEDLIQRKVQGQEITYTEAPEPSKVVDLMEALRASVEAAKSGRPGAGRSGDGEAAKAKTARQTRRRKAAGE
jgi:DNA end-binding protein Ku